MGGIVFGRYHQTAGILIQPMHDAGSGNTANAGQAAGAMGQQSIDQGTVWVAGCRMHHQAHRFIDDDQVLILIDHAERDRLGERDRRARRRYGDGINFPSLDLGRDIADDFAATGYVGILDQVLKPVSG